MRVEIKRLKLCRYYKQWEEQKVETICENGFHVLFYRENGCNKTKLKNLAKNTLSRIGNLCKKDPEKKPMVVFISGTEALYRYNRLADQMKVYGIFEPRKAVDGAGNGYGTNPKLPTTSTVDLETDLTYIFKFAMSVGFGFTELVLGTKVEKYFDMFPLDKYPFPPQEVVFHLNCINFFFDEMEYMLSKNEALSKILKIERRCEYLGFNYIFEYVEEH